MKRKSEKRPNTLNPSEGGVVEFNYNVVTTEEGYQYDSVDVIGEVVRVNIKYAMMLEHYSADKINELENIKRYSDNSDDIEEYNTYRTLKDSLNNIISVELGKDFK